MEAYLRPSGLPAHLLDAFVAAVGLTGSETVEEMRELPIEDARSMRAVAEVVVDGVARQATLAEIARIGGAFEAGSAGGPSGSFDTDQFYDSGSED